MKHLIMGTAGHIDHGKTALIRALTGIDCDTHKEEKQRGITINLGFAHMDMSSGDSVGIVDVPGHKDFVHTMVAGASGIDFALLVVAADEGVMPQTREHLQIMQVLGIGDGIVVLTKADLAANDVLELAREEVAEFVKDTFLHNASVVAVSAATGSGLNDLRGEIERCASRVPQRPHGEVFRLFVDRIFVKAGFGTVVTGSVLGGTIGAGDQAYLLPAQRALRVRRIERHGAEVQEVAAGDRASLNLAGLERGDFSRGMLICDRALKPTRLLDARIELFTHARTLPLWTSAIFLLGTYEAQVRIHLLDGNLLRSGDTGLVQLHLPSDCVAQAGDRFVIRSTSSEITLGGGEIIDAAPLHHRRRPQDLIRNLRTISEGKLPERIAMEVRKYHRAVSHRTLADALNTAPAAIVSAITTGLPGTIVVLNAGDTYFLVEQDVIDTLRTRTLDTLAVFHRRNPLLASGRTVEELIGILGVVPDSDGEAVVRQMLAGLESDGHVKRVGHTWALASHNVTIDANWQKGIEKIENHLRASGMQTPLMTELAAVAAGSGIDQKTLGQILRYLTASGRAYAVDGNYIHASVVNPIRTKLLAALAKTPSGHTVAQFRDLVAGNRKICLLLYSLFDREGITVREGDVRKITAKGRDLAAGGTP